jgi:hypothetical protein
MIFHPHNLVISLTPTSRLRVLLLLHSTNSSLSLLFSLFLFLLFFYSFFVMYFFFLCFFFLLFFDSFFVMYFFSGRMISLHFGGSLVTHQHQRDG